MQPNGFSIIPMIIPVFFVLVFLLVFGIIIFSIIRGFSQWSNNNKQPVLSVEAVIKSRRSKVSNAVNNMNGNMHTSSSTSYYITFEVESGDRMEFRVPGREFGLLAEGDKGKLTFQGTRYLSFERKN